MRCNLLKELGLWVLSPLSAGVSAKRPLPPSGSGSRRGTRAIERFRRPVVYQDVPDALLAPELREENPLALARVLDGCWTEPRPVRDPTQT